MKNYILSLLLVLTAVSSSLSIAEQNYSGVVIKTIPVSGSIYMLQGQGGNIGVSIGVDGVLIIDDQFAPLHDKIQAAITDIGGGDIKFLLNTHWHGDHTGGNELFGKNTPIIAHTNVRKRLTSRQEIKLFNMVSEPKPKAALPVITFDESLSIHFNGEEVKVVHFSHGHTDGDSIIFFQNSNVVHMGDHYFSGMFPFIDLDSGGDVEGFTENIARVIKMLPADVKIIPGHGALSDLKELKAYHQMLLGTTAYVRQAIDSGKKVNEIIESGLPDKWNSWTKGFLSEIKWINIVYQSLVNK